MAKTLRSASLDVSKLSPDEQFWTYNGLDCCITAEVCQQLSAKAAEVERAYNTTRAMQAPAFTLMKRGIRIDLVERDRIVVRLRQEAARAEIIWHRLCDEGLGLPTLWTSPQQLLRLFYSPEGLALPPVMVHDKIRGGQRPSSNREALEKLSEIAIARPFVELLSVLRDLAKKVTVLTVGIEAGRMHCSYNVAGTMTGRWCVSGDTEVLTKAGWIPISQWSDFDSIMVAKLSVRGQADLSFSKARKLEFDTEEPLIKINNSGFSLCCTREHRIPYKTSRRKLGVASAGEKRYLNSTIVGGRYIETGFEPEIHTHIVVMTQADGCIVHRNLIRFHFKKPRKIARCQELLKKAGIEFKFTIGIDGSTYIYVYNPPIWMKEAKSFGPWLLRHDPEVFIAEVGFWDGTTYKFGSIEYTTTDKNNALWVQTMAHLAGGRASINHRRGRIEWSRTYRVYISFQEHSCRVYPSDYKYSAPEKVFCAETENGFFLIRHNNKISITGNSSSESAFGLGTNLQNITDSMRRMFIADEGKKLCQLDLKQAESKLVAYLALPWGRKYLDACLSGDPHTIVCKMIWKDLAWGTKKDKLVAEQKFYRDYSYRFMAKKGGHASNYAATAFRLAHELKIPIEVAEAFMRRYFEEFPEIRHWQNSVRVQLATSRCINSATGRRCHFPGRPWDSDTIKSAVAYNPQGSIGDILNLGLYRVWAKYDSTFDGPIDLLLQVHDAIVFQYPPELEQTLIPLIQQELVVPIEINGETCCVEAEASVGWNWGKVVHDERGKAIDNLWGLEELNGPDERSPPPRLSILDRTASSTYQFSK